MLERLRTPLLATMMLVGSAALAAPSIDWRLSPARITSSCKAELRNARTRLKAVAAQRTPAASAADSLRSVETVIADVNDALIAQQLLSNVSPDQAIREASAKCNDDLASFRVDVAANPTVYAWALAAQAQVTARADKQLAKLYVEAGRRAGAHLDAAARTEVTQLLGKLSQLQTSYMQELGNDRTTIEISKAEAASLPPSFVATLTARKTGYVVPASLGTIELFMKNQASGEARKRFLHAFFLTGGEANARRVKQAIALRDRIARRLGFESWAAYQLDTKMAKTPARALALLHELDAKLLPKARAELATLTALKAKQGDDTPFAAWDYPYYQEQLEQTQHAVDAETVRQHFPIDKVLPTVLGIYQNLFGVRFQELKPAETWAPDVLQYEMTDAVSGKPLGQFFLDLTPRPGKFPRPANFPLRPGRTLPDGSYQQPLSSIIGNGPVSEPGKPALMSHRDVVDFFHEFGHLMHTTLSNAPYASLYGSNVRGDFGEAPSQMLENWVWQPSILKKISSHVTTGQPLPDELITKLLARRHAADGVFWTRQAFLGVYDLTLHTSGAKVDATRLWFELMPWLTTMPPPPTGTIPDASFLPIMGGYDALYYGYIWSRVYAQDMFTAFHQGGLENPEVGMRYRREVLAPGGVAEPDELLENFLGRPVRYDAFYENLGIAP